MAASLAVIGVRHVGSALLLIAATHAIAAPKPKEPKPAEAAAKPAAPATPFDEAAASLPTKGEMPDLRQLGFNQMGRLLYAHLLADADPSRSALIIEAGLQRAGKKCLQISAFQIYRYRTGSRTLKVKCPGMPLYVMTVGNSGGIQMSGGDGTIPELQNADGRIYSIYGREIKMPTVAITAPLTSPVDPVSQTKPGSLPTPTSQAQPAEPAAPSAPAVAAPAEPLNVPAVEAKENHFKAWMLILNGVGLAFLLFALWAYLSGRRRRQDVLDWDISSDDKDALLDESREIYPNIFQHPQGFFISRGRRGKRRLFRGAFPAILYRDFGLKISEIRI